MTLFHLSFPFPAGLERAPYSLASASTSTSDPFSTLESQKTQKQKKEKLEDRIYELEKLSNSRNSDPFALNSKLRDHSRKQRHESIRKEMKDDDLRSRIGWRDELKLQDDDKDSNLEWLEETDKNARKSKSLKMIEVGSTFGSVSKRSDRSGSDEKGKKKRSSSSKSMVKNDRKPIVNQSSKPNLSSKSSLSLASRLLENTRKKRDPFGFGSSDGKR